VRLAISKATQEPQDVASQTLRQLEIQQGYQRIQLEMAGGDNLLTIATSAGKRGDKAMVAAPRVYAPALLISQDAEPALADAVERALALAETPFMGQTQLVCRDLTHELEVGGSNLTGCAAQARSVVSGVHAMSYFSAWRQGGSLSIAEAVPGVPTSTASRGGYQPIY
jgi:hypothetical protein